MTTERFTEALFALLKEAFEHPVGIFLDADTSLFETLHGLSAADASRPPGPGRPTIAAQVEHCRFYVDTLERYIRGETLGKVDWGEIWRTTDAVSDAEWAAATTRLRESYDRLLARLSSLTWDGPNEAGGAMAIAVHTAYHLGQIRLTAKLVSGAGA